MRPGAVLRGSDALTVDFLEEPPASAVCGGLRCGKRRPQWTQSFIFPVGCSHCGTQCRLQVTPQPGGCCLGCGLDLHKRVDERGDNLVVCGRDCLAVAQAAVVVDNSQLGLDTDFAIFHAITQAPC